MNDLFDKIDSVPFVDSAAQRPTVAEEKALICGELNILCKRVPKSIAHGSIQSVRSFMSTQKECAKVLASKASSRQELQTAINRMKSFYDVPSAEKVDA